MDPNANLPTSFDLRSLHGGSLTTAVTDQGECGSCTVFASLGVVETSLNYYLNNLNSTVDFSEQDVISCHNDYINPTTGKGICDSGGYSRQFFDFSDTQGILPDYCRPYAVCDSSQASCGCQNPRCNTEPIASILTKVDDDYVRAV